MEEQTTKTLADPQPKPKRPHQTRATKAKAKDSKKANAAGRKPEPPHGPAKGEHVPTPAPATSQRRPTQPRKTVPPAVNTVPEDKAGAAASQPSLTRSEALQILVDRANAGSKTALDALRQLMNKCPEIWKEMGDLTKHAEIAWEALLAGDDRLLLESIKRFVERLKGELAGPAPSPVELLLAQQAALTWMASRYAEIAAARPGPSSLGEAKMRLKRAESAQRRHLASIKTLTELRAYSTRKR